MQHGLHSLGAGVRHNAMRRHSLLRVGRSFPLPPPLVGAPNCFVFFSARVCPRSPPCPPTPCRRAKQLFCLRCEPPHFSARAFALSPRCILHQYQYDESEKLKKRVNAIVGLRKVTDEDIAALEHKPKPRPPSPKHFPPDVRSVASPPKRPLPVRQQIIGSPAFRVAPRRSPRMVRSPYPARMVMGRPHPGHFASPMRQYYQPESTAMSPRVPSPTQRVPQPASPAQRARHGGQNHG